MPAKPGRVSNVRTEAERLRMLAGPHGRSAPWRAGRWIISLVRDEAIYLSEWCLSTTDSCRENSSISVGCGVPSDEFTAYSHQLATNLRPSDVAPLLRQGLPRSALAPGSLSAAASRRRKSPQGARAGCARVRCQYTDVLSANPGACSRSRSGRTPKRPRPRGCLSLGYFSLGKQREVTRPPGWRTKLTWT